MAAILADDIFKCILFNENNKISNQMSLKFVPRSPIGNKPVLIQAMAWRRLGGKPLPEPMMAQFTVIYATLWGKLILNNIAIESAICIFPTQ